MIKEFKMINWKHMALSVAAVAAMTGCGDTTITYGDSTVTIGTIETPPTNGTSDLVLAMLTAASSLPTQELLGNINTNMTLTSDKLWLLNGLVVVPENVTLTIEPGTVIAGLTVDGDAASYMIVDKNAKIIADGTAEQPIIFTSKSRVENPSVNIEGQWGGLTIIGNAKMDSQVGDYEVNPSFSPGEGIADDNSGILRHVHILNSGITFKTDLEINGLSMVGVGNGTVIEDITVDYSDDDGIEIWGGTVNLKNITISHCTDDHFDIDDGYSGTVTNLTINASSMGYAGIEMSGDTYAWFDGFTINVSDQIGEGGIFFKKSGIGGHFANGTINYATTAAGAIFSQQDADLGEISFENVIINTAIGHDFVNQTDPDTDSADEIKDIFVNDVTNEINYIY